MSDITALRSLMAYSRKSSSTWSPGSAGDVANLWFEPGPIPTPKDTVERVLNHATWAGLITLATAQTAINHSWPTAVTDVGLQLANGRVCLRAAPARCTRAQPR